MARFDEIIAAELATAIPPNRAVLSGGLANLRALHPRPDRFIDGLADNFTATLPDGSAVTIDDLRGGTVTPIDLGFGVTERELIAVRGDRLALIRVEGARWSIEETDEHDQLVRVTMFPDDDLAGAMARFDEISERPEPTSAERWQRELTAMINERRLDQFQARLAEGFTDDSRRTGYSFVLDRDQFPRPGFRSSSSRVWRWRSWTSSPRPATWGCSADAKSQVTTTSRRSSKSGSSTTTARSHGRSSSTTTASTTPSPNSPASAATPLHTGQTRHDVIRPSCHAIDRDVYRKARRDAH